MINQDKKIIISNGTIITPFQLLEDRIVIIEKEKITAITDIKEDKDIPEKCRGD